MKRCDLCDGMGEIYDEINYADPGDWYGYSTSGVWETCPNCAGRGWFFGEEKPKRRRAVQISVTKLITTREINIPF